MQIESIIRRLARSNKYQTLYSIAKEGSIQIFKNTSDYTEYQIIFLNYLVFYYILYSDIACDYVEEMVLEDEIYEDAYFYYKKKSKGKFMNEDTNSKEDKKGRKEDKIVTNRTTWVFKTPKK